MKECKNCRTLNYNDPKQCKGCGITFLYPKEQLVDPAPKMEIDTKELPDVVTEEDANKPESTTAPTDPRIAATQFKSQKNK